MKVYEGNIVTCDTKGSRARILGDRAYRLSPLKTFKDAGIAMTGGFDEKERGSLEEGRMADMVLLARNPLDVPPGELGSIPVETLYLQGKAWKSGQGMGSLLLRGLFSRRAT